MNEQNNPAEDFPEFPPLNLPPVDLKIRQDGRLLRVYDQLRKKYVALTPEEFVRQHFTSWLILSKHYPASIMANEVAIEFNGNYRRCDTVIFGKDGKPLIIVEYKAPHIGISQKTFDQIARYNSVLNADYLIVSNGLCHYCCKMDYANSTYHFIREIPDYHDLIISSHSQN